MKLYPLFFLLSLFISLTLCDTQAEQVEGFFSQSGHTNNWAVLVKQMDGLQSWTMLIALFYQLHLGMYLPLLVQLSTYCQHIIHVPYCETAGDSRLEYHPNAGR